MVRTARTLIVAVLAVLARRLEALLTGDVTTRAARHELRNVAQKIDAELDPDVTTASFVPASDGGERL